MEAEGSTLPTHTGLARPCLRQTSRRCHTWHLRINCFPLSTWGDGRIERNEACMVSAVADEAGGHSFDMMMMMSTTNFFFFTMEKIVTSLLGRIPRGSGPVGSTPF